MLDMDIAGSIDGHHPNIIVTGIGLINHAERICLDYMVTLKGTRPRRQNCLIAVRDFHCEAKVEKREISSFQVVVLVDIAVDPVALVNLLHAGRAGKIVDADGSAKGGRAVRRNIDVQDFLILLCRKVRVVVYQGATSSLSSFAKAFAVSTGCVR